MKDVSFGQVLKYASENPNFGSSWKFLPSEQSEEGLSNTVFVRVINQKPMKIVIFYRNNRQVKARKSKLLKIVSPSF
jgi:hypothetical protein